MAVVIRLIFIKVDEINIIGSHQNMIKDVSISIMRDWKQWGFQSIIVRDRNILYN